MKTKLLWSLAVGLLISVTSAFSQDTNFWIFLCFGQSNMESGGRMDDDGPDRGQTLSGHGGF